MVSDRQDDERSSLRLPWGRETTLRSQVPQRSRVVTRRNKIREFGLRRQVVPLWPAGHVVAWTLGLGKRSLVWGWVR